MLKVMYLFEKINSFLLTANLEREREKSIIKRRDYAQIKIKPQRGTSSVMIKDVSIKSFMKSALVELVLTRDKKILSPMTQVDYKKSKFVIVTT